MLTRPDQKSPTRRPTNVSLRTDLTEAARELEINISQACETGLAAEVKRLREERWKEENKGAIEYWNRYVEEHGLPLARYRQF